MADTWRINNAMETVQASLHGDLTASARRAAIEALERWQAGEPANARELLARHPQLRREKSLVLELAAEEFWQRNAAGETTEPREFSREFPDYQKSLERLLEVQYYLKSNPHLGSVDEPRWPEVGSEFLGFPLLDELGCGAFAQVYLAVEPDLGGRRVALKVSPHGMPEAQRLGKLRHPNIVPVYRVEQDAETSLTAVCMPYLGRATLCDVLDRAFGGSTWPVSGRVILHAARAFETPEPNAEPPHSWLTSGTYIDAVLWLGQQLAGALHCTHQAGMYHLDLKPSNVLLTTTGQPMLLDFNLALEAEAELPRIGGTLPYMSPEQIGASVLRHDSSVDHRSDVFSLGVILYELLCGSLPFGSPAWNSSPRAVGEQLLAAQRHGPRPLAPRNVLLDPTLARYIERAISFDPALRPQTALDLAQGLAKHLGRPARIRRWARSHRQHVYSGIVLAALAAGATAGWAYAREPYWVRTYRQAQAAVEAGEDAQALDHLNETLKSHPSDTSALILRGQVHQRLENYLAAVSDYTAASRQLDDPLLDARRGYCLSKVHAYPAAIVAYNAAIRGGFENATLYCNLGFCYDREGEYQKAEHAYTQAIQLDADSGLAYLGRALVQTHRPTRPDTATVEARVHDIRRALKYLPDSHQPFATGAMLYAASDDSDRISKSLDMLEQSVMRGFNANLHLANLQVLASHPRFVELCRQSKGFTTPSFEWIRDPEGTF